MPLPAITRVSNMEIKSDAKNKENGLRIDAITTTQRDAIPTKTAGLTISNSTTGTLQTYQNGTWGNINTSASFFDVKRTTTAVDYQVLVTDVIIGVTDTTAARTITLPLVANTSPGQIFIVKDESAFANSITIARNGATIDGATANLTITTGAAGGVVSLYSSGTAWFTIEKRIA